MILILKFDFFDTLEFDPNERDCIVKNGIVVASARHIYEIRDNMTGEIIGFSNGESKITIDDLNKRYEIKTEMEQLKKSINHLRKLGVSLSEIKQITKNALDEVGSVNE